ncbi:hypothetical protein LO772_33675 [Yinghuangia sp. ASG 101]|uniref:hypothetical protein n=1 Tax=Yinghuangia sp. ASG 101 TaxID=2896848 RepID=UPI001E52AD25|nr:hypothetical protein [Yinghuangia sp. ASG 101]UGQ11667.1 hypothetical protein LO772_33675 [Yinghuangia sp. ASG 101]
MTTVASFARREWGPLYTTVRTALATRGWRAVPLTLASVCLIALCQILQDQSWGYRLVRDIGYVRAEDPLWLALLRTPLSLFVPALELPVWGALAQVLLVFGIAEITLGRPWTLVVAYVCTLAGTLYARLGIAVGPGGFLGLPDSDARVVDTGPSAAVAGLAVCICVSMRAWFTAGLVVVAAIGEVIIQDNLAGREHIVAIAAALVLCGAAELWHRHRSDGGSEEESGG